MPVPRVAVRIEDTSGIDSQLVRSLGGGQGREAFDRVCRAGKECDGHTARDDDGVAVIRQSGDVPKNPVPAGSLRVAVTEATGTLTRRRLTGRD